MKKDINKKINNKILFFELTEKDLLKIITKLNEIYIKLNTDDDFKLSDYELRLLNWLDSHLVSERR